LSTMRFFNEGSSPCDLLDRLSPNELSAAPTDGGASRGVVDALRVSAERKMSKRPNRYFGIAKTRELASCDDLGVPMGRFIDRFKAITSEVTSEAPLANSALTSRLQSTDLLHLDLTSAAVEIRSALEANQLRHAADLASLRNRASDLQKGFEDPGGPFGSSSGADIEVLFSQGEVFPPGLTDSDQTAIQVSVGLEMLWGVSGSKNTEGVLLGANPDILMSWSEIELEKSLGVDEISFDFDQELPLFGLSILSLDARQLLAQSTSHGERVAKDPDLLRRQVCFNLERFQAGLAELETTGLAGRGDLSATLESFTAAQLVKLAELAKKKIPKSGKKSRQVEVLLSDEDPEEIKDFARQVDASRLANDWWIQLPRCRESAVAKLLGPLLHNFVIGRTYSTISAGNGNWDWKVDEASKCSLCKSIHGKQRHSDTLPLAHLSCRCYVNPAL